MSRKTEIELPMRHPGVIGVAQTALPDKVATPGYYRSVTPAVLLVDDDVDVRTTVCRALERAGFIVWAFSDGRAAWSFLESTTRLPDLVITDLAMPHVTGPELLDRIEARFPGLPCVWVSGLARSEAVASHPELANYASIQKPYTAAEAVVAVRILLGAAES